MKIIIELSKEEIETLNFIDDYICDAALYESINGGSDMYILDKSANLMAKILSSMGEQLYENRNT